VHVDVLTLAVHLIPPPPPPLCACRALSRRTQDNVVCIIVILNKFDADVTKTIKSRKSGMFGMF